MVEQVESKTAKGSRSAAAARAVKSSPITEIDTAEEIRFSTGMGELDRVLGGGAVKGSLVLVGGAPGIGKSTLMLQICRSLGEFAKVLYVSGEESAHQLKLRAQRLQVESAGLFVLSETCLGNILECVQQEKPDILIVDSIQTLYDEELDSPAGGVGQVKDCTMALMQLAKGQGITVFVIGHVNKEGSIAGPKVLEHMVDCVLYFLPHPARGEEPLRRDERDRRVRDDGPRPEGGREPLGDAALRPSGGRTGDVRDLRDGGRAPGARGGTGAHRALERVKAPAQQQRLRL